MPARPAKLTRPQSRGLHIRPRLLAELDQACARQVVWIVGPPGAGKTSLISSYLGARRRPHLWYQVDNGDADPATFFHYLRQGLQEFTGGRGTSVPVFTSAHARDLPGFSRLFFRCRFGHLPDQAVLVLDNYHEAPKGSPFHSAVQSALEQIPEGINVVCASREEPPSELVRLRSGQHIRALGRFELVLNGRPYKAPHKKPPHRQLELLKALVAFGSEGCDKTELADAVWPESEGDRAQNALKVNLSRLRTLLGRKDAVLVQHGRVRLSRSSCWIDAWAFSDYVSRLEGGRAASPDADHAALGLYAGQLLTGGAEQPWLLAARERLHRRWLALVNCASTPLRVAANRR